MMVSEAPRPERPGLPVFWGYQDVLVFVGVIFASALISFALVLPLSRINPLGRPFIALVAQLVWYALIFTSLAWLFHQRYGRPLWQSLGWRFPFRGVILCLVGGPLLAIALGLAGTLIRARKIPLPFDQMLDNRPTLVLFAIFAVALGPLCEELAFRGFLMPLLMRSLGVASGIVLTGFIFGAMHGYEYEWSWQYLLLISGAGVVFGWVRYAARSTAASAFMHATFNLTQLAALLAQAK